MDNHHVRISSSMMSCGVLELDGITDDLDKVIFAVANYLYHPARGQPAAIVTWSTTDERLRDRIETLFPEGEGPVVTAIGPVMNPKTSNMIWLFTWIVPHESLKAWYIETKIAKIKKG